MVHVLFDDFILLVGHVLGVQKDHVHDVVVQLVLPLNFTVRQLQQRQHTEPQVKVVAYAYQRLPELRFKQINQTLQICVLRDAQVLNIR